MQMALIVSQEVTLLERIRMCGLIGGCMSLSLEVGFEVSDAQARPSVTLFYFCWSRWRNLSYFSSTMSACMPYASHHDDTGLNLWTCKPASTKAFLDRSCLVTALPSNRNPNGHSHHQLQSLLHSRTPELALPVNCHYTLLAVVSHHPLPPSPLTCGNHCLVSLEKSTSVACTYEWDHAALNFFVSAFFV